MTSRSSRRIADVVVLFICDSQYLIQIHFSLSARDCGGGIMREPMFIIIYADFIVEEFL